MKSKNGDPWFETIHCKECGHVFGVFTKRVTAVQTAEFKEFLVKLAAALDASGH